MAYRTGVRRTCTRRMPVGDARRPVLDGNAGPGRPSPVRQRYGQAQEAIEERTGVRIGHAQLAGIAQGLAAWTGDFYEQRYPATPRRKSSRRRT